jgi:predicted DsbA family dithiol-disulfide isomerase
MLPKVQPFEHARNSERDEEHPMPTRSPEPLTIDVVSDVVCPWCFIGKRRLEAAIALKPEIPVAVRYRPYFLNPWVPRDGISREEYLTTKFGSVERYKANAQRIVTAARDEGLCYDMDAITRQPNTIDCHRLIHWSGRTGDPARMKQRLMELYFAEGADLSDPAVLVGAAADCGMDPDEVRGWLAGDKDVAAIEAEAEAARNAGIDGVPCFILGGVFAVSGAQSPEYLADAIERAAAGRHASTAADAEA